MLVFPSPVFQSNRFLFFSSLACSLDINRFSYSCLSCVRRNRRLFVFPKKRESEEEAVGEGGRRYFCFAESELIL